MAPYYSDRAILSDPFETVGRDGRRYWAFEHARILPVIAGAEGEGSGGGEGGTSGEGSSGGNATGEETSASGSSGEGSSSSGGDETDPKVKQAREEAISERQKRQQLEKDLAESSKRLKEHEDKDKSDLEKAQGSASEASEKLTRLEQQNREFRQQIAFAEAGREAGALYPEKLHRFADDTSIDVETDDDGRVKNAPKIVEKLREAMPELFGKQKKATGSIDQGPRSVGNGKSDADVKPGADRLRRVERKNSPRS